MDDSEIIMLFYSRSENALSETKAKYGNAVAGCIGNILRDSRDAEECEIDTYMGAWNSIPPASPVNLRAYLLKIARNIAISRFRFLNADKRGKDVTLSFEEIEGCISETETPYSDDELKIAINDFLASLPFEARRVFMLRYWYCASVRDIMAKCNISKSKTESMLFRTRNKLKKFLKERGLEP